MELTNTTRGLHPNVEAMNAEVDAEISAERAAAPPVVLSEPVLDAPLDAPKTKDIQLTESDDFLPYLADVENDYDLQEQAYQQSLSGETPKVGVVKNEYLMPLAKTVRGIDVATGDRILNRGDFNNEEAARNYRQGAEKFRQAQLDVNLGYDQTGITAATHIASGIQAEGKNYDEYRRSLDMMNMPEWQAQAAWHAADQTRSAAELNTMFSREITSEEVQSLPPDPLPDLSREELMGDAGWKAATQAIYESEEAEAFDGTDQELMDWYVDEMSNFNWKVTQIPWVNTSSMAYYGVRAYTQGEEYAKNFLAMMDYYDRMNTDWGVVGNSLAALAGDPTSYIGLGAGAVAGKVTAAAAKNRLKSWVAHTMSGATAGAVEGAVYGGFDNAVRQSVKVDAGAQESIDKGDVLTSAAIGGTIGKSVGGLLGLGTSPEAIAAYRRGAKQVMQNARRGQGRTVITGQKGALTLPVPKRWQVPQEMAGTPTLRTAYEVADATHFKNNRQLKEGLQAMAKSAMKRAGVNLAEDTDRSNEILTGLLVDDAQAALAGNPNAVGWYNETVGATMDILSQIHPELATDKNSQFAFTFALANTSNGLKVDKNFELAEEAYKIWKDTGQMPTDIGIGTAKGAINKSQKLFNDMVAKIGIEAMAGIFDDVFTVKQLDLMGFEVSGELMDTTVRGAAMIGPKIGNGFYSNLRGKFDALTMDRWFVRTWGRQTGTLLEARPDMVRQQTTRLNNTVAPMKTNPDLVKAWKGIGVNLRERSATKLSNQIKKSSMDPHNRTVMNATPEGSETRLAGNALWGYKDGQKEDPANGSERNRMRQVLGNVLTQMRQDNPDLTMSDLQALLWYAEKRLYDKARSATEVAEGYLDDEAPDYANAAADLARKNGVSDDAIMEADQRGRATAAGRSDSQSSETDTGQAGKDKRRERREFIARDIYQANRPSGSSSGKASSYKRTSRAADRNVRGVVQTYEPKAKYQNLLNASEMRSLTMEELAPSRSSDFVVAISESAEQSPFGSSVHVYPDDQYKQMRTFLSPDKQNGFAVKEDGDIVSVFSSGGGGVYGMLELAVEEGGTKLDAFDTVLPDIYETAGFVETGRYPFDPSEAPDNWDRVTYAEFNDGEPDLVLMEYRKPEPKKKGKK
jgi:hypothetical protein